MRIERATSENVREIAQVLRAAFEEFEPQYTPAAFRATTPSADQIAERLDEGPIWIAIDAEGVIGTVSAVQRDDEVYLRSMAVIPNIRGRGVASQLLDAVAAFARTHNAVQLTLMTTPFLTSAISLYTGAGFEPVPERFDLHGTPLMKMVKPLAREPVQG